MLNWTYEEYIKNLPLISQLASEGKTYEVMAECFDDFTANKESANILSKNVVDIAIEFLEKSLRGEKL